MHSPNDSSSNVRLLELAERVTGSPAIGTEKVRALTLRPVTVAMGDGAARAVDGDQYAFGFTFVIVGATECGKERCARRR